MTYVENIFICLAIPLIMSLFFVKGRARQFVLFLLIGMSVSLLSAYVNSFFMAYYDVGADVTVIEITPVCEEIMKLLPLILYFLIFEPESKDLPSAAIAIGVGFATFENVCYLTKNGAENFTFLFVRGFSAGALHLLCAIFTGICISYVLKRDWLVLTGTLGMLGVCTGFHAIYNLLISTSGVFKIIGYFFPSMLIVCIFVLKLLTPRLKKVIE